MTEFKKVTSFAKEGEILAKGNERILRLPRMADIKYKLVEVGVAALSAVIESQRPFRVDQTDFEDITNNSLLGS